jgi:hypothetical protein
MFKYWVKPEETPALTFNNHAQSVVLLKAFSLNVVGNFIY